MCIRDRCIVSKNAVETYGDDNDQMLIGTGAYKFVSNTTGVGVTLESNKDYWGGEPYFETINYKLIPDNNTALTALLNGEIDLDQVTTAPVSYTHLDVYKRQGFPHCPQGFPPTYDAGLACGYA